MPEQANPKLRDPLPPPTSVAHCPYAYAELDVTSNFSFLRGASHPDELVYEAATLGYRAIAITDRNTLAGAVRAHAAAKSCGLKLLIGARLTLEDCPDLLVWATDRAAYGRLCRLLTLGKRRVEKGEFSITLDDFFQHSEGLLVAACGFAEPGAQSDLRSRKRQIQELKHVLGDRLSLAVARVYGNDDDSHLNHLLELSHETHVPLLAINAVHYHDPNRRALQDVLTCIRHGCTIHEAGFRLFPNGERYLKSPEQMHRLFSACPQAIHRGVELAARCDFKLDTLRYEYPDELVPTGQTPLEFLTNLTWRGAAEKYPGGIPGKTREQIHHELQLIEQLKFEAYFLTVHDLVRFARERGILCQGRGSAANSAVCYCIGVTSVDPSKIDLLFERFISAARNEPPDIDVDFEHERREEVIQYVYQKYGRDRSGMTATLITYRGKSAVRDVGKAMGLSLDMVDSMAKRLDWWHRGTLTDEQLREAGVDPADKTVRHVIALTAELLGFPRHLGQHTGGMIMTRGPLCEMVPIENASMEDRTVVEWDKNDIEELGLLKVDVLALGMLTMISKAFKLLNGRHGGRERHEGTEARRHEGEEAEERQRNTYGKDSDVSGLGGMAARDGCCAESLSNDEADAFVRTIWTDESNATSSGINPVEYCGGLCTTKSPGLSEVPENCEGVVGRILRASVPPCLPPPSSPSCLRAFVPSCLQLHTIPPDDPAVYDMICNADTIGVFQIESRAQMSMLPRLRPRCFYDLVIEVAIVRPGPIQGNMVHPYLRRRCGEETVSYPSEALRAVLQKTLGVPLFQEQAMKVAMVAAGFSADEADQLRRAMAAWRRSKAILTFHQKIIDGMVGNGYTLEFAEQTFNQIQGFGEYGFPESHSASFALLVYVSAWIKCHHPAVFCCALLNSQPMGFYMPAQIVRDAREHGVEVRAVDVNASEWDCTLEYFSPSPGTPGEGRGEGDLERREVTAIPNHPHPNPLPAYREREPEVAVRLGFRQIKGLSSLHIDRLLHARQQHGPFQSVEQFHRRTGLPRSVLTRLAEADTFACLGLSRRQASWQVMGLSDEQLPLFDEVWGDITLKNNQTPSLPLMPTGQEVMTDYKTAGLSLKEHPMALVRPILKAQKIITARELYTLPNGRWVKVAGLVLIRQRPGTASGIVFETLEDETGIVNLIVRPDIYDRYRAAARHAALLQCDGYLERHGQVTHVMAKRLFDRSELISGFEVSSRDFH